MSAPTLLRFDRFELDVQSRELRDGSTTRRLQAQVFEILRLMLEHRGAVVTRDQFRERLWPGGTFVDVEHSLNAAIKRLRAALGDDADEPRFVETVPRRGYRLIAGPHDRDAAVAMTSSAAMSPGLRLAVLPFANLSGDSRQEHFSDGLTEEVMAQLSALCRGELRIIARSSTTRYKGWRQRAREIGEALQAGYLLEGSTRHEGSRVRITVRLVEAMSEVHVWSDTVDRKVTDWLSVQTDVARELVQSLIQELAPGIFAGSPRLAPGENAPARFAAHLPGRTK
jgi:TolB-like protein